ncbi:hypothetical protein K523DRAFT_81473 [Schizophyllum commune Tattone D]|nr:hypothetical protein K523DRAFT_81473 [Schizophyllum commune Tattone D]
MIESLQPSARTSRQHPILSRRDIALLTSAPSRQKSREARSAIGACRGTSRPQSLCASPACPREHPRPS